MSEGHIATDDQARKIQYIHERPLRFYGKAGQTNERNDLLYTARSARARRVSGERVRPATIFARAKSERVTHQTRHPYPALASARLAQFPTIAPQRFGLGIQQSM